MASAWDNLNGDFASRVRGLMAEAQGRVTIVSGFRSPARQQQIWATALAKYGNATEARKWAAPPGHSSHEHGEAMDLAGDLQLAHMLAPKYGLHFPMDGTNGKGNEPWHVERVGWDPKAAAYTTGEPTDAAPEDHVDRLFKSLNDVMSGNAGLQAGEADTSVVGEKTNPAAGEFSSASLGDTLGGEMSGATQPMGGVGDIDKFMNAIGGKESGGNYNATNKDSGASGKYQIMPANWGPWSSEAGLGANAAMTPQNQEKVARYKIEQYYKTFGNWSDVAKAWYGGPGAVKGKNGDASQGAYPTINKYAEDAIARMGAA